MKELEVLITNNPNEEDFVAEIWYNNVMVCELFENREITFYAKKDTTYSFDEFVSVLNEAEKRLFQK